MEQDSDGPLSREGLFSKSKDDFGRGVPWEGPHSGGGSRGSCSSAGGEWGEEETTGRSEDWVSEPNLRVAIAPPLAQEFSGTPGVLLPGAGATSLAPMRPALASVAGGVVATDVGNGRFTVGGIRDRAGVGQGGGTDLLGGAYDDDGEDDCVPFMGDMSMGLSEEEEQMEQGLVGQLFGVGAVSPVSAAQNTAGIFLPSSSSPAGSQGGDVSEGVAMDLSDDQSDVGSLGSTGQAPGTGHAQDVPVGLPTRQAATPRARVMSPSLMLASAAVRASALGTRVLGALTFSNATGPVGGGTVSTAASVAGASVSKGLIGNSNISNNSENFNNPINPNNPNNLENPSSLNDPNNPSNPNVSNNFKGSNGSGIFNNSRIFNSSSISNNLENSNIVHSSNVSKGFNNFSNSNNFNNSNNSNNTNNPNNSKCTNNYNHSGNSKDLNNSNNSNHTNNSNKSNNSNNSSNSNNKNNSNNPSVSNKFMKQNDSGSVDRSSSFERSKSSDSPGNSHIFHSSNSSNRVHNFHRVPECNSNSNNSDNSNDSNNSNNPNSPNDSNHSDDSNSSNHSRQLQQLEQLKQFKQH